ncbi:MAG: (E)-4-hydroxy-3-methylbut-2-enyl-diphosphate synthase [Muribaculaceae bacterium]|nr:(E)-4-hydroxy-3-methylbut-2-enyl-diphosphate synthase [Muribaculaceae bacterium]
MSIFNYKRRQAAETRVGSIGIGGSNPIRLQSMTNTRTTDTEGSARQVEAIAREGADLVRLTTQGVKEAEALTEIKRLAAERGVEVPIVADVHFNPAAAYKAAETCEKVRINPGNFADPVHRFETIEFTDEEYARELDRLRERLVPFLEVCRTNGTAIRLGVNHGSLSDRIVSRYGDTPRGMVESLMEYLRICKQEGFNDVVLSIKASNVVVMVETVRLLVEAMEKEGMAYPLHLGVTEAGNEDEGRIKSAAGIGTLLAEGIGDTLRVSLSEAPEREIPVARLLRDYITAREGHAPIEEPGARVTFPARGHSRALKGFEKTPWPPVEGYDFTLEGTGAFFVDASEPPTKMPDDETPVMLSSTHANAPGEMASWIERFLAQGGSNPIILRLRYDDAERDSVIVKAAADFGSLLLNGYGNGLRLEAPGLSKEDRDGIALGILQAVRLRFSRPDYIACPGCGRTLFNLEQTLGRIKKATSHLKGVKIGVMGCIVNGPGEMADADYGYVGAGPGRVSLYKGKELIRKNIPEEEAVEALLQLINSES